ncbi:MAG: DUF885 domain-containing protein [Pirellulaceae bacterium]
MKCYVSMISAGDDQSRQDLSRRRKRTVKNRSLFFTQPRITRMSSNILQVSRQEMVDGLPSRFSSRVPDSGMVSPSRKRRDHSMSVFQEFFIFLRGLVLAAFNSANHLSAAATLLLVLCGLVVYPLSDGLADQSQGGVKKQPTRRFAAPKDVDYRQPAREYVRRNAAGWTVWLERELAEDHDALAEEAMARLEEKLKATLDILPSRSHQLLRELPIYLMLGEQAALGGRNNGARYFQPNAPAYRDHLDPRWSSALVIYSARNYTWLSDHWSLLVLLHEFSHAWHLEQWPEKQPDILKAWKQAVRHKTYEGVKDVNGKRLERAYAVANQLEYFAELSGTYFLGGEYEPFDRAALRERDPAGLAMVEKMWGTSAPPPTPCLDEQFERVAALYLTEFPAFGPVSATALGDHRFDSQLDEISDEARAKEIQFHQRVLKRVRRIDPDHLSRENQIDHALLQQELEARLWRLETLQEWAWNPLLYTSLAGSAVYNLMARDFAPLEKRLHHAADRLEQFPRLFDQIRTTLEPQRVPRIHAETAVKQNRGVLNILDNMVKPRVDQLEAEEEDRLLAAMKTARSEVKEHQEWLESTLLPNAEGDFRLGSKLYDQKLAFTLKTPLTRQEVRERAESALARARDEMYRISCKVYKEQYPHTEFPDSPSKAYKQAIVRACLEMAYQDSPPADEIVATARRSLKLTTDFVRENDLLTLPPEPIEIIIMPEFQRGVSLAYCDSPGPLDAGLKTYYAVAPLPDDWTEKQIQSFLREYNTRSIHDLTMHEAMPGHFVQLAHANRYPNKLRAVLSSGVFIEGWAIYSERMMIDQGFLDGDPLMRLINLKWYLRGIANALMDQAIHTRGMTREEAMKLMMEETFQEEREAAAKWVRAQLTSAQLSTYFIGASEHFELRREVEKAWGDDFTVKRYHDEVLAHGSPPVQFVRALILDKDIPRLRRDDACEK